MIALLVGFILSTITAITAWPLMVKAGVRIGIAQEKMRKQSDKPDQSML